MDSLNARFQCLRLAAQHSAICDPQAKGAGTVLAVAKEWAAFVIGDPVKSSASFGKAGADDPKK